ncbi:MAG: hypothetical protein Q8N99_04105 [Nanoarchaeota archaeon]|nr:hypothetical protein [Nanoarchaeota archaeon]
MEYGIPERRKNKNDKRAKARYNRYKRGGAQRIVDRNKKENT